MSFQDDQVFLEKYLDEHLNTVLGLRLAERYISTDNLEGAHQTLTEFLESNSDNATAMFLLGEIAFKEGDNEKAQNLYEETIQADPSYTAAYHRLVTISTDDRDEATVKDIYALLNRLNPLDSQAAAEVGEKGSDASFKSDFSKKVLNQFTLTTADPEENLISSEAYTEPANIPLGGEDAKTEIEIEEVSDEEGSFDLDSAGETEEVESAESGETSSEDTGMTDSEDSDKFGVQIEPDEPDNETDSDTSEPEESSESGIEESEEDNPFGVGGADEADEKQSEDEESEEEQTGEESTEDSEDEAAEEEDKLEETEEDSEQPEDETVEEPVVEEIDSDDETVDEETTTESSDQEEEPFGTEESEEEQTGEESSEDSEDIAAEEEDNLEESESAGEVEQAEEDSEDSVSDSDVTESSDVDSIQEESEAGSEDSTEEEEKDSDDNLEETDSAEESEQVAEDETVEEPAEADETEAEELPEEENNEEIESDDEITEKETTTEATDKEEDPFGSEDTEAEESSAAEESPDMDSSKEEESESTSRDSTEDDKTADADKKISDSIVDQDSRGFELPPFSKETLADIQLDDQNESSELNAEEGNDIIGQDEGADALNIPLDSDDDSDNTDNLETTTENMIDDSGTEEHNIPLDEETATEEAGLDTPSDYESWVDKDVTPGSMTSGGSDDENNINKNTFEGLLSEPDVAVETLDSENPEEESDGIIIEETEDFQKKIDNIYNLDEEEEISPLQAWFLEKNSSGAEEQEDKGETKSENVDPPLTEPMPVPFSEEESQDGSDSDKSEDNDKEWDDFVETTSKNKTDSVVADKTVSKDSESVATEVDRDLQNIFDDVVTTDGDDTDKQEDDAEESKSASIGGVKLSNDLATFTLAEIYTNQGQYTEALSVLDLLENNGKDPDKISSMREEIKEKIEEKNR